MTRAGEIAQFIESRQTKSQPRRWAGGPRGPFHTGIPAHIPHEVTPAYQPTHPQEVRLVGYANLTSARRECLWTFSPFCTLGASCCRTPLLLVRALVSRANFPQPEAGRRAQRQGQPHTKRTQAFSPSDTTGQCLVSSGAPMSPSVHPEVLRLGQQHVFPTYLSWSVLITALTQQGRCQELYTHKEEAQCTYIQGSVWSPDFSSAQGSFTGSHQAMEMVLCLGWLASG